MGLSRYSCAPSSGDGAVLQRLLGTMLARGTQSLTQLAGQLNVSQALIKSMIDDLTRMGYLKPLEGTCTGACESCHMATTCGIPSLGRVWVLTDAGKRAAQSETD